MKNKFLEICKCITVLLSVHNNLLKRIHLLQVSIYTEMSFSVQLFKLSQFAWRLQAFSEVYP